MVLVGEAAAIVAVVGWFVSPNIAMLMEVARSCASTKYKLSTGIKAKLQKLAEDLEEIKALLVDPASMGFVNDATRLDRLWRLKDGIHDAEEILDLFQLEILQADAENNPNKLGAVKKKPTDSSLIGARRGSLCQLEKVLEILHERAREVHQDPHRLHAISPISSRPATAPCPVRDRKFFFGYDKEYGQLLVSMLPDGSKDNASKAKAVIAIVGHGGMGKTELARQVFRDVKGKFDLCIWVHAYGKLTELDLLKEIWKSADGAGNSRKVGDMNLSSLQRELEKLLKSQRCLLVLDDVWNHERATSEVERKRPRVGLDLFMSFVGDGSRVVVTTRAKICSATLGAGASIVLNGIEHKQATLLLNHTAELGAEPGIQELIDRQVPKLKGSPLAAIEIGDEMREKPASRRSNGYCCDIWRDIEHHMGSVFSGHLFTYQHLPPHLQRCFAFCSVFPFGWRFEPEKLTWMWIAHGFVEDRRPGGKSMEDVARGYFDDLVHRSLFQREASTSSCRDQEGDRRSRYVIHEHIHWMIRRASAKDCISITRANVPTSIPPTVRHLSVTTGCLDRINTYSTRLSNLRTLLVIKDDDDGDPAISAIDKGILEQFTGVRVVDFTETGIIQLPESIGKLTHVRYLGLPCTTTDLCPQVTKLLFLQTLSVSDTRTNRKGQVRLPEDMNRLINMRHLDIHADCISNISGIGGMVKLQGSIEFQAVKGSEKAGHSVSELAGMNYLGGTLSIKGLDAVASKDEAMESCLAKKSSVKVLKLQWRAPDPRQVNAGPAAVVAAAAVLEGLQPHADIHDLRIARYPGATWPSWLAVLEKLTRLYLWNCRKLRVLPALGGLPCLELLDIKELTSVERIDAADFCGSGAFPELKKIVLDDMPALVAWGEMPKQALSRLREVSIFHCPLLSSLSGLESCGGPLHLSIKGCPAITPATLPANFSAGASTYKFG